MRTYVLQSGNVRELERLYANVDSEVRRIRVLWVNDNGNVRKIFVDSEIIAATPSPFSFLQVFYEPTGSVVQRGFGVGISGDGSFAAAGFGANVDYGVDLYSRDSDSGWLFDSELFFPDAATVDDPDFESVRWADNVAFDSDANTMVVCSNDQAGTTSSGGGGAVIFQRDSGGDWNYSHVIKNAEDELQNQFYWQKIDPSGLRYYALNVLNSVTRAGTSVQNVGSISYYSRSSLNNNFQLRQTVRGIGDSPSTTTNFGAEVAIVGDSEIIVSGISSSNPEVKAFRQDADSDFWIEYQEIARPGFPNALADSNVGEEPSNFGKDLAVSRDGLTLFIGAYSTTAQGINNGGAICIYQRQSLDSDWSLVRIAGNPDSDYTTGARWGFTIATNTDGRRLAVGAYSADSNQGSVHVYLLEAGDDWATVNLHNRETVFNGNDSEFTTAPVLLGLEMEADAKLNTIITGHRGTNSNAGGILFIDTGAIT